MRSAVVDLSRAPSVFVPERQTASRVGAWFTGRGFSAPHRLVDIGWTGHHDGGTELAVTRDGHSDIDMWLRPRPVLGSSVFATTDEFATFLAAGQRSYGRSRHDGRLTVLDLHKSDAGYEPHAVERVSGAFVDRWRAVVGEVDSALRTTNARYEWKYYGLIPDGGPPRSE